MAEAMEIRTNVTILKNDGHARTGSTELAAAIDAPRSGGAVTTSRGIA